MISSSYRIIPTIRKHIVAGKALSRAAVGIGVEESSHDGVVIAALEAIEARLFAGASANGAKIGGLERRLKPPPKKKIAKTDAKLSLFKPALGGQPPSQVCGLALVSPESAQIERPTFKGRNRPCPRACRGGHWPPASRRGHPAPAVGTSSARPVCAANNRMRQQTIRLPTGTGRQIAVAA